MQEQSTFKPFGPVDQQTSTFKPFTAPPTKPATDMRIRRLGEPVSVSMTKPELKQPTLPLPTVDPRKIQYQPPPPIEQDPTKKFREAFIPERLGPKLFESPAAGQFRPEVMEEFRKWSEENPATAAIGGAVTGLAQFPTSLGGAALTALGMGGGRNLAAGLFNIGGLLQTQHGLEAAERAETPLEKWQAGVETALGVLGIHVPRARTIPPEPVSGTSARPPLTSSEGTFSPIAGTGTGERMRGPLFNVPRGYPVTEPGPVPPIARTTGTGTPTSLMPGRIVPPTGTVEAPVSPFGEATPTGTPETLRAPEVPYTVPEQPAATIAGGGEIVPQGQFRPGQTGTGGWSSIEAVVPPEPAPSITKETPSGKLDLTLTQLKDRWKQLTSVPEGQMTREQIIEALDLAKQLGYEQDWARAPLIEKLKVRLKRFGPDLQPEPDVPTAEQFPKTKDAIGGLKEALTGLRRALYDRMLRMIARGEKFTPNQQELYEKYRREFEGSREKFGGEEPGPETAEARGSFKRTQKLVDEYKEWVNSLTPAERAERIAAGQYIPDFNRVQPQPGGGRGVKKVWVENWRTREGKGAFLDERDIAVIAENWKRGTKGPEPPEITTADYGRLKAEQEGPLLKDEETIRLEPERTTPPEYLSNLSPLERQAEIRKLKQKGKLSPEDAERLRKLEAANKGFDQLETFEQAPFTPPKFAEPSAAEPPAATPKLAERAARRGKPKPVEPEARPKYPEIVQKFQDFVKSLPLKTGNSFLDKHIANLRRYVGARKLPEQGGEMSLVEDFDAIKNSKDIDINVRKGLFDNKYVDELIRFYEDETGSFDPLWWRRRKEEMPPGWSIPSGRRPARSIPKSPKKPLESKIRQVPRNVNYGSDVDLGGLDPNRPQGILGKLYDLPRNLMGFDPVLTSAAIRQVFTEVGTKPWRDAFVNSINAWGDAGALDQINRAILQHPMAQPVRDSTGKVIRPSALREMGIRFSNLGSRNAMEEMIRGEWGAKIPVLNRSTRAFTAFLNTAKMGMAEKVWKGIPGIKDDVPLQRLFGDWVNNATGSGGLGKHGEKVADGLSTIFFAPRLAASRFHMMRNLVNPKLPWIVRKQYIKSAVRGAATIAGLALTAEKFVPGIEVVKDPTNPDFMKLKYNGKVRIDLGAGYQQLIVLAWKLARLQATSSTTGETHTLNAGNPYWTVGGEVGKFAVNKLHPSARLITDLAPHMWRFMNSESQMGNEIHLPDRLLQLVVPLNLQAIAEVMREDPSLMEGLTIGGLGLLGIPTQSYEKGDEFGKPVMWPPPGMEQYDYVLPDPSGASSTPPWER